jgi:penicillin-binding protein 2
VLVADARSGRLLGGIREAQARTASYYPASLFKLAIAVSLLESGARLHETFVCTGADTLDGDAYRCWNSAGHGALGLEGAIAHSCNVYFRRAARELSTTTLADRARSLGLLPSDFTGRITPSLLLGEAATVTPAIMLGTALTLASRGRLARPTLPLSSPRYRPIYQALRDCVRSGTARAAWSRRTAIAGKTGTAAIVGSPGAHAGWFIGFAPFDRPLYAIVVLEPRGVGSEAAAIAREVLETLL